MPDLFTFRTNGNGEVRINASRALPAAGWKKHKGNIYQTETDGKVMAVFQNGLPLACPWKGKGHHHTSLKGMYPNSTEPTIVRTYR